MSTPEIAKFLLNLSKEDKEKVKSAIWFLDNEATSDVTKILYAFDLVSLINEIKENGRK